MHRCPRMLIRSALYLVILLVMPHGTRADVGTPDTPAGHTLQAFLDAFNSADHDRIAAYVKEYDPQNSADGLTSFSNQTGGFRLVSIVHTDPDKLSFLVHGRGDNIDAYGTLQLASTSPPLVKRLNIRAIPPGAKLDDIQLGDATRQKAIDAITNRLTEYYVYPDVAAKMGQAIHDHQKHGDYSSITDGNEFADALARDLRAVSHDQHLHVSYDPFTLPDQSGSSAGPSPPSPAEEARFRSMLERQNCTFSRLEVLDHNIGYVKFGAFPPPDICGPTVVAAMNFLAHTDALIFDLRENHGGDPNMVDFMVSYLFRQSTHVNDLTNCTITRPTNTGRFPGFPDHGSSTSPSTYSPLIRPSLEVRSLLSICKRKNAPPSWAKQRAAALIRCEVSLPVTISLLASPSVGPSTLSPTATGKEKV